MAQKQAIAEAAVVGDYDKVAALAQEAKSLEGNRQAMMSNTEDVARVENIERDAVV